VFNRVAVFNRARVVSDSAFLINNLSAAREFFGGARVDASVLAHVERVKMKAEGLDLSDERVNELTCDATTVSLVEARAQQTQVFGERRCVRVRVAARNDGLARGARSFARSVRGRRDRKSTRLNSSHRTTSYAVFCLKKK